MVHVDSSNPADKLPRMWSKETFTTDISITSIKVGRTTDKAMIHLLILLIAGDNSWDTRHAHAQNKTLIRNFIKNDLNRNPLDNLDVVT